MDQWDLHQETECQWRNSENKYQNKNENFKVVNGPLDGWDKHLSFGQVNGVAHGRNCLEVKSYGSSQVSLLGYQSEWHVSGILILNQINPINIILLKTMQGPRYGSSKACMLHG